MQLDETVVGFLEYAARSSEGHRLGEDGWSALRADGRALGFFGLLAAVACPEPPDVDPAVREELVSLLDRDLRDALGEDDEVPLATRFERYVAAKGERGAGLLTRVIARIAFDTYDLAGHGFLQENCLAACALLGAGQGEQGARAAAQRLVRVSRRATRVTLGHLDSQLELVHRLGNAEMPIVYSEVDRRLEGFAPRIYAQRLPSIARQLILEDKQFRFAFVLWGRLRGLVIPRTGLVEMAQRIVPEQPMLLIQALEERKATREAFVQASQDAPLARLIEGALLQAKLE